MKDSADDMINGGGIMSMAFPIGVMCGIVFVVIVKMRYSKNGNMDVYDERQIAEQGRAAKWGFYSLMAMNCLYGCVGWMLDWLNTFEGVFLCMMVALGVYVGVCIYKEAYFPVNKNSYKLMMFTFAMGLLNLVIGILAFVGNGSPFDEDGVLLMQSINIMVGLICMVVPAAGYAKIRSGSKSLDDYDSEEE